MLLITCTEHDHPPPPKAPLSKAPVWLSEASVRAELGLVGRGKVRGIGFCSRNPRLYSEKRSFCKSL